MSSGLIKEIRMRLKAEQLFKSWVIKYTDAEKSEVLNWISEKNNSLKVSVAKGSLSDSPSWFYDRESGEIRNADGSFFSIRGLRRIVEGRTVLEQPILIQSEIGYLGIICKEIDGVLKLLMQAKIEPGNVNKIQISPTIQATRSNFTQRHGGKKPSYIDYFLQADRYDIIFDQIQSEQSSRFLGKRNRNILIKVEEDVDVLPNYRWMTLGQIKELMKIDNLVNMDTRTVLSCIPFYCLSLSKGESDGIKSLFNDKSLYESMFSKPDGEDFIKIFHYINNYKMFNTSRSELIPLDKLADWDFSDSGITHRGKYSFKVIFADIEIEGREVTHWTQPLFEAIGMATFGLITADFDGKTRFLVQALAEVGCFDDIELAPTVQLEAGADDSEYSDITRLFFRLASCKDNIRNDVILSEEGGRFYCEQNRNIILKVDRNEIGSIPDGYFWADYSTINYMLQFNNVLNIQLRNLLSLLEI